MTAMNASSQTIANAPWMRLVALVLAILFGVAAWFAWERAQQNSYTTALPVASELPALGTPASVDECIAKRSAQIDALLDQGLMDADAAKLSLQRARSVCTQRN
jgi:hypothetical protein